MQFGTVRPKVPIRKIIANFADVGGCAAVKSVNIYIMTTNVNFPGAIRLFFQRYADFRGRSTRAEYWYAQLFNAIIGFVLYFIPAMLLLVKILTRAINNHAAYNYSNPLSIYSHMFDQAYILLLVPIILFYVYSIATLIPNLAIFARRLHDTGRSGWWTALFAAAPVVLNLGSLLLDALSATCSHSAMLFSLLVRFVILGGLLALCVLGIVWLCKPSAPDNEYGPDPYAAEKFPPYGY